MREVVGDVAEEQKHNSSGSLQLRLNVSRLLHIIFEMVVKRRFIADKLSAFVQPDSSARKRPVQVELVLESDLLP